MCALLAAVVTDPGIGSHRLSAIISPRRIIADLQFAAISQLNGIALLVEGQDFEIRPSTGKGLGVFALRDIPQGTLLGRYTGEIRTLENAENALRQGETSGDYFYLLNREVSLDSKAVILDAECSASSSWCRYVNHSRRLANCELLDVEEPIGPFTLPMEIVVMVATQAIGQGRELLFDYGSDYWDNRLGKGFSLQRLKVDYF